MQQKGNVEKLGCREYGKIIKSSLQLLSNVWSSKDLLLPLLCTQAWSLYPGVVFVWFRLKRRFFRAESLDGALSYYPAS